MMMMILIVFSQNSASSGKMIDQLLEHLVVGPVGGPFWIRNQNHPLQILTELHVEMIFSCDNDVAVMCVLVLRTDGTALQFNSHSCRDCAEILDRNRTCFVFDIIAPLLLTQISLLSLSS